MIHDPKLTDILSDMEVEEFAGEVYRATRKSLDPLAASSSGGRWMPRGEANVLYTALSRDGALAELTYHWGMLSPLPSKPAVLSRIDVNISSSLRVLRTDFAALGVDESRYEELDYSRMQEVGAALAFLEYHGLIVPSARWGCENLIVFTDNLDSDDNLNFLDAEEVDWQQWGKEKEVLSKNN